MRIVYRPSADRDLSDIFRYIAQDNDRAAEKLIEALRRAILRLQDHPLSAPSRAGIMPGLRGLTIKNYIVFYLVSDDRIEILRVLHAARDHRAAFPVA